MFALARHPILDLDPALAEAASGLKERRAPVFPKIKACVTDIGGMMSHAAIVCREYSVPAVTGTGFGTDKIKTGDRIRVDGSSGTVTILD